MRLAAQFAPDAVLLAAVAALARLCFTQGHRTRRRATHGHTGPGRHDQTTTEGDSA